jgi:outer membrane immunogenic protein
MMRRFTVALLAATAMGVIALQAASAADIVPRKAPPPAPPPAPIWNWTGFYFGGHFGAGWTRDEFHATQTPTFFVEGLGFGVPPGADLGSHTGVGPLGGFQLGYNYQFPNTPWVVGLEGEFSFADLKGDHQISASQATTRSFISGIECNEECFITSITQVNATANEQLRLASKVKDIALITARFGITSGPEDRTLWYVKGGGAWAKTDYSASLDASALVCANIFFAKGGSEPLGCTAGNGSTSASGNTSRWGWTVGTGVEWGLAYNLSAKIEYDFLDFGSHGITLTDSSGNVFNIDTKQQIHEVKVGLNYRFNWGAGYGGY